MNSLLKLTGFGAALILSPVVSRAVVTYNGNSAQPAANYAAPGEYSAGWNYVGTGYNSSGGTITGSVVYLGDDWVITAAHVGLDQGLTAVGLLGNTYDVIAGSMIQLTNADGGGTDLVMFRVNGDSALDSLANLTLAAATPSVGSTIMYIGNGYARGSSLSYWNVVGSTWNVGTMSVNNERTYSVAGAMTKSWGKNTVSGAETIEVNGRTVSSFYSTFSTGTGSAMLYTGDSGGATFVYNTSTGGWELAGINEAIATLNGQPAGTAAIGDRSYSTDLSSYSAQIRQIMTAVPEPAAFGLLPAGGVLLVALRRRRTAKTR